MATEEPLDQRARMESPGIAQVEAAGANVAPADAADVETAGACTTGQTEEGYANSSIDDNQMPAAILARIAKIAVGEPFTMHKDARHAVAKVATAFVSYLAFLSDEVGRSCQRKTVIAQDVFAALETDFSDFLPQLRPRFDAYKRAKKSAPKAKVASAETAVAAALEKTPAILPDDGVSPSTRPDEAMPRGVLPAEYQETESVLSDGIRRRKSEDFDKSSSKENDACRDPMDSVSQNCSLPASLTKDTEGRHSVSSTSAFLTAGLKRKAEAASVPMDADGDPEVPPGKSARREEQVSCRLRKESVDEPGREGYVEVENGASEE